MSSRELALFGTSADPPTEGHQALLLGLAQRYDQVVAWASDNPFKQHGAPLELRAQLLGTLIESLGNDQVQLAQDLSSPKAIETLDRAASRWPDRELVFVVGGDLAGQIPSWYRAADLLQRCRLTVVPRQGHPMATGALERLRDLPVPATASSAIRGGQQNSSIPEVLWPELLKHNLYGLTSKLAP